MQDRDRRLTVRLRVDLPVAVDTTAQTAAPGAEDLVRLVDLSAAGGQIACGYLAACRMVPRDRSLVDAVGAQWSLRVGFDGTPPADDAASFPVVVTYSQRRSQDDYRFGVRFEELAAALRQQLLDYFDQLAAAS